MTQEKRTVLLRAISSRKVLGRLTLLLVLGMAIACFWPLLPPGNTAVWVAGGHGVDFGKHGLLLGPGPLRTDYPATSGCTLDLWVEPDRPDAKGAILAAYSPANARLLTVEQFRDGLAVRSSAPGDPLRTGGAQLYTDNVFSPGKPVLLTITSTGRGTSAFVNGIWRRTVPNYRICQAMFGGKLVVGTGAASSFGWRGRLAGMAIIDHALTPAEAREDYRAWPNRPGPALRERSGLISLYPFDEGSGVRVHDEISGANGFWMPDRYRVVAKPFLSPPSFDHHADIVNNVIGFIPLGFTLCGYLSSLWRRGTAVVATVLLCGLFSLTIEMLQWYLPTRDSSTTDFITNTAGGIVGVLLYRLSHLWIEAPWRQSPTH